MLFLFLMSVWAKISSLTHAFRAYFLNAVVVLFTVLTLLTLNYAITGLAEVTPFRFFWQFANQAKFAEWVSPFLMLLLDLGSSPDLGTLTFPDMHQFPFIQLLMAVFRLDRAAPVLLLLGFPLSVACVFALHTFIKQKAISTQILKEMLVFIIILIAAALIFFSVNQIGSIYRLYMFCMFPVIALSMIPFALARISIYKLNRITIALLLTVMVVIALPREIKKIPRVQRKIQLNFIKGKTSIAESLASQKAVWKEAVEITNIIGHVPVWSTQVGWHFCIAPACNLKTFFSFAMHNDWATVMFENSERARAALQKQGLNYFAFDTNTPAFDLLPYSPLFSPEHIAQQMGLVWSHNGIYLLTWRSEKTLPIPPEFIALYRKSMQAALVHADFPMLYQQLAIVFLQWKTHPQWPVKIDPRSPRPRGWQ